MNIIYDKLTTFHWFFQLILMYFHEWIKKPFCNFIYFIIQHDFYVTPFWMNYTLFIIIIFRRNKISLCQKKKKERKGVLYNTYRELLSEKWIVIRYRFHASYIISPQLVAIFATSHLVGCIVNYYNSLANKVDKSAVATSYKVVWIDFTLQNMVGQKFSQYNIKYETQKPSNENPTLKYTDTRQTKRFIESWSSSTTLVPYNLKFSKVHWYFNKNIVSQLYYTYRNYVHLPEKTNKNKQKKENKKQKQNYSRL